ncbi:MAG: molybdopterin-dependent oxidoreductase [Halomonas sp.]|uniref:molybdopterin-dependent oxidoreductase n=1 Tax=Halomonas sp. TaxID=1486246 RepID=UPI0019E5C01F|nr:molybdopterin-dependent oxidoreductase [Halomonas sp.]MBE0488921.1 molybdopterin-dependent oxidoreductase [Halomonas sp.]
MRQSVLHLLLALVSLAWLPMSAVAEGTLPAPSGEVLLTISGNIDFPNVDDQARFDREMLMAIAPTEIHTRTPWHSDAGRYEGPLFREVLAAAGVRSDRVLVRALNDYEAEIPLAQLHDYDVILAMSRNGAPVQIREFGPLFVLYPFDDHPQLHNESVRFRSVWHVVHIHAP